MARTRGQYNFSGNLEIKKTSALDARLVVKTYNELILEATWADSDGKVWLYEGMLVSVLDKQGLYMLVNYDPVNSPNAYKSVDNWKAVDASAAKLEVVDNLESTDTESALSANQGRLLVEKIEAVKSSISGVYTYKGSVTLFANLPLDAAEGDVYNVVEANGNYPAGTNYAWNGSEWDALGGSVDLSTYVTLEELEYILDEADYVQSGVVTALTGRVTEAEEKLATINGTSEISGSLANTLKLSKDYTDTQLTGYVQKEEGKSLISSDKLELIDTTASGLTALEARVEANEASLLILNSDKDITGSVLNTVNTSIENYLAWNEF